MSWIKVRVDLATDPRVDEIAKRCKTSRASAIGALVSLWCYADTHSVDGAMRYLRPRRVDEIGGVKGFAQAAHSVGWLLIDEISVTVPRFSEHNSGSAKLRAQGAVRQGRHRAAGQKL